MPGVPPNTIVTLMGPTAAGKTDLALALAELIDVDIISVDSAMIYRGMDIGTAKPPREILARYPHRLIDIRDPTFHWRLGSRVLESCWMTRCDSSFGPTCR